MNWMVPALLASLGTITMALCGVVARRRARGRATARAGRVAPDLVHSINDERCTGCGACADACPAGVLVLRGHACHLRSRELCVGCERCARACVTGALVMHRPDEEPPPIRVPELDRFFQTAVPGQYLIGDVAGRPLVKHAANLGRAVVEHMVDRGLRPLRAARPAAEPNRFDVLVAGAGPGGLAAGLACLRHGLRCVVLERDTSVASTIARYPKGKQFVAAPEGIRNLSDLPVFDCKKEELLEAWERIIDRTGLDVRTGEAVEQVTRLETGDFAVVTSQREYRARRVVIATGVQGTPRKLGVPGEDRVKVHSWLDDPAPWRGRSVLVVGGGDSALEAACSLAEAGAEVTLSYRRSGFRRASLRNRRAAERAAACGSIEVLFESHLISIGESSVVLEDAAGRQRVQRNDAVFVLIGATPPATWLSRLGIRLVERPHAYRLGRSDELVAKLCAGVESCPSDPAAAVERILGAGRRRRILPLPPHASERLFSSREVQRRRSGADACVTRPAAVWSRAAVAQPAEESARAGQLTPTFGCRAQVALTVESSPELECRHDHSRDCGRASLAVRARDVRSAGSPNLTEVGGGRSRSPADVLGEQTRQRNATELDLSAAEASLRHVAEEVSGIVRGRQLARCIDCGQCARACERRHGAARMRVEGGRIGGVELVLACRNCDDQRCVELCESEAITFDEERGIVLVDQARCDGCGLCARQCGNDAIEMVVVDDPSHPRFSARLRERLTAKSKSGRSGAEPELPRRVANKCDRCVGFRDRACVRACPTGALTEVEAEALLWPSLAPLSIDRKSAARPRRVRWLPTLLWGVGLAVWSACLAEVLLRTYAPGWSLDYCLMVADGLTSTMAIRKVSFRAGDELALYCGFIGTGLMLLAMLYPLLHRTGWGQWMARNRVWLDLHVACGTLGPLFIALHSANHLTNWVAVAFWSMVLVVLSGAIGRYLYPRAGLGRDDDRDGRRAGRRDSIVRVLLRGWRAVHISFSVLLIAATSIHVWVALRHSM